MLIVKFSYNTEGRGRVHLDQSPGGLVLTPARSCLLTKASAFGLNLSGSGMSFCLNKGVLKSEQWVECRGPFLLPPLPSFPLFLIPFLPPSLFPFPADNAVSLCLSSECEPMLTLGKLRPIRNEYEGHSIWLSLSFLYSVDAQSLVSGCHLHS